MPHAILSPDALARALSLRDLADPAQGPHAMQLVVDAAVRALSEAWRCAVVVHRAHPVVPVADNYDRLHYPPDGAARDARHTRYVSEEALLRTQTSALVPPLLSRLAGEGPAGDALLASYTGATPSTGSTPASPTRWTCGGSGAAASRPPTSRR